MQPFKTNVLSNLMLEYQNKFTSILTYSPHIRSHLAQFQYLVINHTSFSSHSSLLALYLAKMHKRKVSLLTLSKHALYEGGLIMSNNQELDKIGVCKEILKKEGVQLVDLCDKSAQFNFQSLEFQSILIVDVFQVKPSKYYPLLLECLTKIAKGIKILIYHSHLQAAQINEICSYFDKQEKNLLSLQLTIQFPFQRKTYSQPQQLQQEILFFLQNYSHLPQRMDIVLYYPLRLSVNKYVSKLKQLITKEGLKDRVNFITKNNQNISENSTNIFIVSGSEQLKKMHYDYSHVYLAVDFGNQLRFFFDYTQQCYVKRFKESSTKSLLDKMSVVGVQRLGVYACLDQNIKNYQHFTQTQAEISSFVVQMIYLGYQKYMPNTKRVSECIAFLKEIGIIIDRKCQYQLSNQKYYTLSKQGISPLQAYLLIDIQSKNISTNEKQRKLNLIAMALAVINIQGNLRQTRNQLETVGYVKPYPVWRKSGYLQSCLYVLSQCILAENKKKNSKSKSQNFKKKSETINPASNLKNKKAINQMDIADLFRNFTVNEEVYMQLRNDIQRLLQPFNCSQIPFLLQKQDVTFVFQSIIKVFPKIIGTLVDPKSKLYSQGSNLIMLHQNSLTNLLNLKPQRLMFLRIQQNFDQSPQILISNSISDDLYTKIYGEAPVKKILTLFVKKQEKNQQDDQESKPVRIVQQILHFDQICSAVLRQLCSGQGTLIQQFQEQHFCLVIVNYQKGKVDISRYKNDQQDSVSHANSINMAFKDLLKKLKNTCKIKTKILNYMGSIQLIFGKGGRILQLIQQNYVNKCLLKGLPKEIPREYLQVVLQDYTFRNVTILDNSLNQTFCDAIVQFYNQQTFLKFKKDYQNRLKKHNYFEFCQIKQEDYVKTMRKINKQEEYGSINYSLQFKWFVWKSHGKAQVHFSKKQSAAKAIQGFINNRHLDSTQVKVYLQSDDSNILNIQNLKSHTDQIFIRNALGAYGTISKVQILKTPLKETAKQAEHLQYLVRRSLGYQGQNFHDMVVQKIEKKQFGLRQCRIKLLDQKMINIVCEALNGTINNLGEGRLYAQTIFQDQLLVPQNCLTIYMQILSQVTNQYGNKSQRSKIESKIMEQNEHTYILIQSNLYENLDIVVNHFKQRIRGITLSIPIQARNIIISEQGIANLAQIQQNFDCKFRISTINKKLKVVAKQLSIKSIQKQIDHLFQQHFFYAVSLTSKNYKQFKNNPTQIQQLQNNFELKSVQLEEDSHCLSLQGNVVKIQQAINSIFKIVVNKEERQLGESICRICYSELEDPYCLMCSHRFCKQCLQQYLRISIEDMSMFPFKCPDLECRIMIQSIDLDSLFDYEQWSRLKRLGIDDYLKNDPNIIYCFTPGCAQINRKKTVVINGLAGQHIRCDVCLKAFCTLCQGNYHPARTCQQAKMGQKVLFDQYLKGHGVRKCVNPNCKVLVERYTGCFKVQCSRCSVCMCFKCPQDQMIPYWTPKQCYDHLNSQHGGFF